MHVVSSHNRSYQYLVIILLQTLECRFCYISLSYDTQDAELLGL